MSVFTQIDSREREYKEAMKEVDANRPKFAHTQGPWLRSGTTVYALMHDGWRKGVETFRNRFYCSIQRDIKCSHKEAEANAILIAAAPDLLEALQSLIDMDVGYMRGKKVSDAVDSAKAVIAKATGAA